MTDEITKVVSRRGRPPGGSKFGGRKAGTPNRPTLEFKARLEAAGIDPVAIIAAFFADPDAPTKEKASIATALLRFEFPVLKAVELAAGDTGPLVIQFTDQRMAAVWAEAAGDDASSASI